MMDCQKTLEKDILFLQHQSQEFFNTYGSKKLLGSALFEHLGIKENWLSFEDLLKGFGYPDQAGLFFEHLCSFFNTGKQTNACTDFNQLPKLYLYTVLEDLFPGQGLYTIKTIDQLKKWSRMASGSENRLQAVIDRYPVRLSDHVLRQSMVSRAVAGQYLPFIEELDITGDPITFEGHLKNGVLEQMYENRVILLVEMRCPVYCRFCFRKHKTNRQENPVTAEDICKAVDQFKKNRVIKEVLITGGEPFLNRLNLDTALDQLKAAEHVRIIRIATRSVAYYPELLLKKDRAFIRYLIGKNEALKRWGKRIEIGVHFVHPDDVSIQSLKIISFCVQNGIQVYVQTPFLNGINTRTDQLARLFSMLRNAGAKIYYIFTPCSPIHGTKPYWTSISQAKNRYDQLVEQVSDRCLPKLCTATPLGKIEWGTSGWAVEKDRDNADFIWIRTPYTLPYYQQFVKNEQQMPVFRKNIQGTLDAKFRADIGDEQLFIGKKRGNQNYQEHIEKRRSKQERHQVRLSLAKDSKLETTVLSSASTLEINMSLFDQAIMTLSSNPKINEVIFHTDMDIIKNIDTLIQKIQQLKKTDQISFIRLKIPVFNLFPKVLNHHRIHQLAACIDHSVATPFRLEVETFFLHPEEITPAHVEAAENIMSKGMGIYANVPVIQGVNDTVSIMTHLAHQLRYAAIEFHFMVIDGLSIQAKVDQTSGVDKIRIIDLASDIRRSCSGREIPLYGIQTEKGIRPVELVQPVNQR